MCVAFGEERADPFRVIPYRIGDTVGFVIREDKRTVGHGEEQVNGALHMKQSVAKRGFQLLVFREFRIGQKQAELYLAFGFFRFLDETEQVACEEFCECLPVGDFRRPRGDELFPDKPVEFGFDAVRHEAVVVAELQELMRRGTAVGGEHRLAFTEQGGKGFRGGAEQLQSGADFPSVSSVLVLQ